MKALTIVGILLMVLGSSGEFRWRGREWKQHD
jgi:hypothetical protein